MFQYDEKFYNYVRQTKKDEEIIMPFIIQRLSPKSIIDFGCGEGAWLKEALHYNNEIEVFGLDGDYIEKERLRISEKQFMATDLQKPIILGRHFDLAISTEVAEHLEESFVDIFLDNITNASDQILFSAAVPGQGGVHHVNEQWQSYWIEKFEKRGYYCDYSVRNYFWNKTEISSWRKQNLLFFSKERKSLAPDCKLNDVIHPQELYRIINEMEKRLEIYIMHPEIYIKLDRILAKLVLQNKKIVIYPYGTNGRLCEKILQHKYGIDNYIISDNNVVIRDKRIYRVDELKNFDEEFNVIETCSNIDFHKEVLQNLIKYIDSKKIYSAFEVKSEV